MPDSSLDLGIRPFIVSEVRDERPVPVVLVVLHGIRDNGDWQAAFSVPDAHSGLLAIEVHPISYRRLDTASFLFGWRDRQIDEFVLSRMKAIVRRFPSSPVPVFAHSNGAKVLARILDRLPVRPDGVFLAGAVCTKDDAGRFDDVRVFVANDCGLRDLWPLVAAALRPSVFGDVGVVGFGNSPIVDRFFAFGHAGALDPTHFQDWIYPSIVTGRLRRTGAIALGWRKHAAAYLRRAGAAVLLVLAGGALAVLLAMAA